VVLSGRIERGERAAATQQEVREEVREEASSGWAG
jgi:hypothetical protein